jgi:hypothetical protein
MSDGAVAMTFTLKADPGASGAHVAYITRSSATGEDRANVWTHNVPDRTAHERDYHEMRDNLRLWADHRARDEFARAGAPSGRLIRTTRSGEEKALLVRTHYRAVLSFDRDVSRDDARAMTDAWLDENFGSRHRSIAAFHTNTDRLHVHVWLDARQTGNDIWSDGAKLHISSQSRIRESWARIYGERFGREIGDDYVRKSRETTDSRRAFKAYADARDAAVSRGERFDAPPPPRPERTRFGAGWAEMSRADFDQTAREEVRGAAAHKRTHEGETRGDQRSAAWSGPARAGASRGARDGASGEPPGDSRARDGEPDAPASGGGSARGSEAAPSGVDRAQAPPLASALNSERTELRRHTEDLARARTARPARDPGRDRSGGIER